MDRLIEAFQTQVQNSHYLSKQEILSGKKSNLIIKAPLAGEAFLKELKDSFSELKSLHDQSQFKKLNH